MWMCETWVTGSHFLHWMWSGLNFSPFNVLWLWNTSRNHAWSFPQAFLSGPRESTAGIFQATWGQDTFLLHSCFSFDFPGLNHTLLQSKLTSSSLQQSKNFRTWRWILFVLGVCQFMGGQYCLGKTAVLQNQIFGKNYIARIIISLKIPVH